jgi:hypothetical protein
MALQRINTAFGPNPIRFNGNIQPQANANVFLGNTSFQFSTIYAATFSGTATHANLAINLDGGSVRGTTGAFSSNLVCEGNVISSNTVTGSFVVRGGVGIGGNVHIAGSAGRAITVTGNIVPSANLVSTNNLGSDTLWWNNFYGVSTQARYADLAENYQADYPYAPGTVLEFGGEHEVTIASDGTRRVAGVVSTNPAHLMNGMLRGPNVVPLALQGRTPCLVRGKINKGDMLISGGNGYARPDNNPQIGTIIGKALEDFDGIEGIIEVVVGRM